MTSYLNYLIEANAGLCFFALACALLLKRDTDFKVKRMLFLAGVMASVIFPMFHIKTNHIALPALSDVIPVVWLPEFTLQAESGMAKNSQGSFSIWKLIAMIYACGVVFFLSLFLIQLIRLIRIIKQSATHRVNNLIIAESNDSYPSFSFFNFIFIGQASALSQHEKEQIIAHEQVHAQQRHSFDIIVINIIGIFFWFNPVVRIYRKIFVQLHEFEADARAVKTHDVNEYCNLLARVALMSADIRMANYFNNSLTLKRIEMIRKIKMKLHRWKIATVGSMLLIFFVTVACHDQVIQEVTDIAQSSTMALDVPAVVQQQYDQLKANHPDLKLLLIEVDAEGKAKLEAMQQQMNQLDQSQIAGVHMFKPTAVNNEPVRNFMIIQYNEQIADISERSKSNETYTIVEESAAPVGGMPALYDFLSENITYPKESRASGIEGKVLVGFVVEPDGTITSLSVLKGVDPAIDAEALRVMALSPKWTPAKNKGMLVRQKLVLPINFSLGDKEDTKKKTSSLEDLYFQFPIAKKKANSTC
ncbi:MAG TPA: M56 family metallopeptidase [Ohtaekwangia sp.]|nr:M56 family metallopeptidase [Ohtaekwangia sp.]